MEIKKSGNALAPRLSILSNVRLDYSATTAESVAAESTAAESATTGVASSTTVAVESTFASLLAALFPQEAKDTAANATNKNTNFFIFFAFLICNTMLLS